MKGKIILILFLVFGFGLCEGQSWDWAKQSYGECDPSSIAADKLGNIYETGIYADTLAFGKDTLISGKNDGVSFLTKYGLNGNVLWAESSKSSSTGLSESFCVSIDAWKNSYITGFFTDTVSFGSITLTNGYSNGNMFIVKYDSNGSPLWARSSTMAPNHFAISYSDAIDDSGNIYVTGAFNGNVTFGSFVLINNSVNASNTFLVKYDSSGNVLWAKCATRLGNGSSYGQGVATDHLKNVYITGNFADSIIFDTIDMICKNLAQDAFIVKYSGLGNQVWAKYGYIPSKTSGVPSGQFDNNFEYIIVDNSNNLYSTGTFVDTIGFDTVLLRIDTNVNSLGTYLVKYAPNGNILWGESSSYGGVASTLSVDKCNNIYWSGTCGVAPFSLGGFNLYPDSANYLPSCFFKLDSNGKGLCGAFEYIYNDDWDPIVTDPLGNNVYFSGDVMYYPNIVFGSDTLFRNKDWEECGFLAKWSSCGDLSCDDINTRTIQPEHPTPSISLFPNPSSGLFTLAFAGSQNPDSYRDVSATIEIYNVLGEKVTPTLLPQSRGGASVSYTVNISSQPNGLYFYRVINEDGSVLGSGKVVIQK